MRINAVNNAMINPNTNVTRVIGIEYFTRPSSIGPKLVLRHQVHVVVHYLDLGNILTKPFLTYFS